MCMQMLVLHSNAGRSWRSHIQRRGNAVVHTTVYTAAKFIPPLYTQESVKPFCRVKTRKTTTKNEGSLRPSGKVP